MQLLDRTTLRVALTLLLIAAVLVFLWAVRSTLLIFLFAILFAYLLEPLVSRLQRLFRGRRALAIAVVYVAGLLALATLGAAAGPKLVDEGRKLAQVAPDLYEKISSGSIARQVGQSHGWSLKTQARLEQLLTANRDRVLAAIQELAQKAGQAAGNSLWFILIPILAAFFLGARGNLGTEVAKLIGNSRSRRLFLEVLDDLDEMLAHFVRAQVYLGAISALAYTVALSAMRVPYALVLGVLGGMLEFIPLVGPITAGAIMLAVTFTLGFKQVIALIIFLLLWRGVQDYVTSPRILGRRVSIHPLLAIFGVLVGGEIGGVAGIYLSVPAMAALRILWMRLRRYQGELLATQAVEEAMRSPAPARQPRKPPPRRRARTRK